MGFAPIKASWFHCGLCDTVAYKFSCCGNSTCNGGGCHKCRDSWDEAWRLIEAGDHPPLDEMRHYTPTPNWLDTATLEELDEFETLLKTEREERERGTQRDTN